MPILFCAITQADSQLVVMKNLGGYEKH